MAESSVDPIKMALNKYILLLLWTVGFINCATLVTEKCNLEDSKCMTKAFQAFLPVFISGIPELGVEVMDVMDMDDVKFDLAGLKFSLSEAKLKGLRNSIMDSVKWDTGRKRFTINFHTNCTIKGHYIASGRILILPITGDGNIKLKMRNLKVNLYIDYDLDKNADGKDIISPNKYGFDYDIVDNVHYDLSNLFNGNKELSDTMLTFLNENWQTISKEFGTPIMEVSARKMYKNIAAFLSHMPIDEIIDA